MRSTWKRVLSAMLVIAMIAGLVVVPAYAATTATYLINFNNQDGESDASKAFFSTNGDAKSGSSLPSPATMTLDGESYTFTAGSSNATRPLKMNSSGNVTFTPTKPGTLTVVGVGASGWGGKLGVTIASGTVDDIDPVEGQTNLFTKHFTADEVVGKLVKVSYASDKKEIELFYISWTDDDVTAAPAFSNNQCKLTGASDTTISYTLTNKEDDATYTLYSDSACETAVENCTGSVSGDVLTFTLSSGNWANEEAEYYVTSTVGSKESTGTKVVVHSSTYVLRHTLTLTLTDVTATVKVGEADAAPYVDPLEIPEGTAVVVTFTAGNRFALPATLGSAGSWTYNASAGTLTGDMPVNDKTVTVAATGPSTVNTKPAAEDIGEGKTYGAGETWNASDISKDTNLYKSGEVKPAAETKVTTNKLTNIDLYLSPESTKAYTVKDADSASYDASTTAGVTYTGYLQGATNPTPADNVPAASYFKFVPKKDGLLAIGGKGAGGTDKPIVISSNEADDTGDTFALMGDYTLASKITANFTTIVEVKANKTYYYFVNGGSKVGLYGITFWPKNDAPSGDSNVTGNVVLANLGKQADEGDFPAKNWATGYAIAGQTGANPEVDSTNKVTTLKVSVTSLTKHLPNEGGSDKVWRIGFGAQNNAKTEYDWYWGVGNSESAATTSAETKATNGTKYTADRYQDGDAAGTYYNTAYLTMTDAEDGGTTSEPKTYYGTLIQKSGNETVWTYKCQFVVGALVDPSAPSVTYVTPGTYSYAQDKDMTDEEAAAALDAVAGIKLEDIAYQKNANYDKHGPAAQPTGKIKLALDPDNKYTVEITTCGYSQNALTTNLGEYDWSVGKTADALTGDASAAPVLTVYNATGNVTLNYGGFYLHGITVTKQDDTLTLVNVSVASSIENGTVTADLTKKVPTGTEINVTATPADDTYELATLTAGGANIKDAGKFTANADTEISATFTKKTVPMVTVAEGTWLDLAVGATTGNTYTAVLENEPQGATTWSVQSSAEGVATATVNNGVVTVTAKAAGNADITVKATIDGTDYTAANPIKVEVYTPDTNEWNFATSNYFKANAKDGQNLAWRGLNVKGVKGHANYGTQMGTNDSIEIPVSGKSKITLVAGWSWDLSMADATPAAGSGALKSDSDQNGADTTIVLIWDGTGSTATLAAGNSWASYVKSIKVEAALDTSALTEAIADAQAILDAEKTVATAEAEDWVVSDDGNDVPTNVYWVTTAVKTALSDAIATATAALDTVASEEDVTSAVAALKADNTGAIAVFVAARQTGTRKAAATITAPTGDARKYDGQAKTLTIAGVTQGAKVEFKVKDADDSTYTETVPTATTVSDTKTYTYRVTANTYVTLTGDVTLEVIQATWDETPVVADNWNQVISYEGGVVNFTVTKLPGGDGATLTAVCDQKPGNTINFNYNAAKQEWTGTNTIEENQSGATHTVKFTYTNGNYDTITVADYEITQNAKGVLTAKPATGVKMGRSDYAQYGIAGEIEANEVELTVTESALLKAWADETKHATLSVNPGPFCDHGSFWAKVMFEVPEGFDKNTWKIYEAATEAAVKTETTEYTGYDIETSGSKTYFVEWFGVADVASDVLTIRASRNVGSLYYRFNDGTDDVAISVIKVNITKVDKTDLSAAKAAVPTSYDALAQANIADQTAAVNAVKAVLDKALATYIADGVSYTLENVTYTASTPGTLSDLDGTDGSLAFDVKLTHANAVADETVENLTVAITATAYVKQDANVTITLGTGVASVTYKINAAVEGTTITATGATQGVVEGDVVTITAATFANGYELDEITNTNGSDYPYTLTGAPTVKAKAIQYTITYTLNDSTNAATNPATFVVTDLPITLADATGKDGYTFKGWTGEGTTTATKNLQITTVGNKAYTAVWEQNAPDTKTITVTLGSNVTSVTYTVDGVEKTPLTATGDITVGTSAVVTITAITYANGYEKDNITTPYTVTGTSVTVNAKQTQSQGGQEDENVYTLLVSEAVGKSRPFTKGIITILGGGTINEEALTVDSENFTHSWSTGSNASFSKLVTDQKAGFKIVTNGAAEVKVWFKNTSTGSTRGPAVYKLNADGTDVEKIVDDMTIAAATTGVVTTNLTDAGTYYVSPRGNNGDMRFIKVQVTVTPDPSVVNKSALIDAISAAEGAIAAATVSTDGNDVLTTNKWVLQSDVDTYQAAVNAAKAVKNNADATQEQVNAAKSTLDTATAAFNAAKKDGKKDASTITAPENSWYVGQLAEGVFTETNNENPAFTTTASSAAVGTVDGVKLYLGATQYVKFTDSAVTTTTYPSSAFLQGQANADKDGGTGSLLKFVAEKRGTLHVTYAVLKDSAVTVKADKVNGNDETSVLDESKSKGAYDQDVEVIAGDTVYFYVASGSKIGVLGFYFEEDTSPTTYTVTYTAVSDTNGVNAPDISTLVAGLDTTVAENGTVTLPAATAMAVDGYTFVKWTKGTSSTEVTGEQTITANTTFKAHYTKTGGTEPEPEKANLANLTAAIQAAEALGDVTVSTDGSDVLPTEKWMTQAEKEELAAALAAAKLLTEDNTQAEVDAATSRLETAKGKLKNGTKVVVTKAQLESAVNTATKLADGTDVATDGSNTSRNKKWVEQGVMDTYKAAIQAAAAVAADPSATEDDYKAAKETLDAATEVFNSAAQFGTKAGSTSSSRPSGGSGDSSNTTTPTKPVTTTETKPNGTQVTTTKNPDGTVNQTITNTDGTKTSAVTKADGETTATVTVPDRVDSTKVTVPVEGADSGTVAIIVNADGTEEIIRDSAVTEDGVVFELEDSATVKIVNKAKHFVDIDGHWAKNNVNFVSARELFNGVDADHFAPDATMTRGMMATVLFRLDGENAGDVKGSFNDVKDGVWYSDAVEWASDSNIVNGYTDGTFAPDRNITREELAVMVYRYALAAGLAKADEHVSALKYADADQVSSWAVNAMSWLTDNGILNGKLGNVVDPKATATRAEVSAVLERYVKLAASK